MAKTVSRKFPVKLIGEAIWVDGSDPDLEGKVPRAIWRSANEIVLDCESSAYDYGAHLLSKDGVHFEGRFSDKTNQSNVKATVRLFSNPEGVVLAGRWIEDDSVYRWWVVLDVVDHFSRESPVGR